jgi:hypothetical protein
MLDSIATRILNVAVVLSYGIAVSLDIDAISGLPLAEITNLNCPIYQLRGFTHPAALLPPPDVL